MSKKTLHKNITVQGRVQGVAFRKYTYDTARELTISGYVRNKPDGSVYIEAEGSEENLKQFIQWCHQGSPFSKVTNVSVSDHTLKHYTTFEIL